ncbi:MAG: hypothetical protein ACJAUV_001285 [Flavobacteriales bacterium]|jgi:hypothetical protein
MKSIIILPLLVVLLIASCNTKSLNTNNRIAIRELTESTIEEFYDTYKYQPIKLDHYRLLMDAIIEKSEDIRQYDAKSANRESLMNDLKDFKLLLNQVNKHVMWIDKIINKEYKKLFDIFDKNDSEYTYQFDYLEYLITNELLKVANYDTFKFEKIEIAYSQKLTNKEDSIEISIFPKAVIEWYNPLIIINNDTIKPIQLSSGTAKILVSKTDYIRLSGEYQMRQNFNIRVFQIDTILPSYY